MGKLNLKKAGAVLISLSIMLSCTSCAGRKNEETGKENSSSKQEENTSMPDITNIFNREMPADAREYNIIIDGNDIRTDNKNGLTYKGFGILSGNSTSDLLMDYKAETPEAYAELMQYLFGGEYPIMNHVKLEMGNDRNNSTGPETATKRSRDEVTNILRNPGWQLAADAKRINPDIKTSILKWNAPAWVKTGKDIYNWYKEAILAAYEQYGFIVDYINPNTNERWNGEDDVKFTKEFAKWIDEEDEKSIPDETARNLFKKIKLVVSDESGTVSASVAEFLKSDKDFYNAVDVTGYHYSTDDDDNGGMKWFAEEMDKEVWNSEAQAVFSNSAFRPSNNVKDPSVAGTGIGGIGSPLEMANTFIKGFVNSRRSHVIYQPGIGSFYEGGQFSFKELASARDPWSGWIHYDAGLLMLAHLSKFAKTGWEDENNTTGIWRAIPEASASSAEGINPVNGRNGGENYMTLASPGKDNFSTMIVNDSEYTMVYNFTVQNINYSENAGLAVWETRAADEGAFNENYLKYCGNVTGSGDGKYKVTVLPFSAMTVTTLDVSECEGRIEALPAEGERFVLDTDSTGSRQDTSGIHLYADNFDYTGKKVPVLDGKGGFTGEEEDYIASRGGDTGAMARYTHTLNGAFEVYKTKSGRYVLRQQLDEDAYGIGSAWNNGDAVTVIGDLRWMNYAASADVLFEDTKKQPYAAISIRQTGSSHTIVASSGYTLQLYSSGKWNLYRRGEIVLHGKAGSGDGFKKGANQWNNLRLEGAGGKITAYINDKEAGVYNDKKPITAGRIGLGSSYTFTQFSNLRVDKIKGEVPYYTELLDNMETYDLTPGKNTRLVYNGEWTHENGQSMFVYQRSISTAKKPGASLEYTFTGTGLEILAGTFDKAKLRVIVDGEVYQESVKTQEAGNMNMIYSLNGLEYGEHMVKIELLKGVLKVDMVGILGDVYK
ncbi:MAG: sugar-binding protein [Lachnospiraceae bacterium]|nr:sugar-binding protein [Lachnospiraceae bacterium]